jgi:alpha-galactosidase
LPERACELFSLTGRWTAERRPQRHPFSFGTYSRSVRRGRTGHDATDLLVAGTAGFRFRQGEVWAVHLAWSGDSEYLAERLPEGAGADSAVLGAGELLAPGEMLLPPGATYLTPEALFGWSDQGLDGLSERFHAHVRSLPSQPSASRPVVFNTWEAVYFDQREEQIADLARMAANLGVERFVLDDGWFQNRRSDNAGLGDWLADRSIWPHGLKPLIDLVHSLGMTFGLWFEPEMANLDSNLARDHPEWLLDNPELDPGRLWRHQIAVNLANPAAYEQILEQISAIVSLGVDFIKWDHNADLPNPVDQTSHRPNGHAQVRAVYRLLDELRARHSWLEIESCASGGGRIDLGIAQRTQRFWASDTNDPLERQRIQRFVTLLVPPERVGTHVSAPRAHTTGRLTDLSFRLTTALFGHAGIEWDIRTASTEELATVRRWIRLYKRLRPLLSTGITVRADLAAQLPGQVAAGDADQGCYLHGLVSPARDHALFAWVRLDTSGAADAVRIRFPGLDPLRSYRLEVLGDLGLPSFHQVAPPAWIVPLLTAATNCTEDAANRTTSPASNTVRSNFSIQLPGEILTETGLALPRLNPLQALLFEFS